MSYKIETNIQINTVHTVVLHFVAYRENNPLMSRAWASPAMTACDWNYL